MISRYTRPAMGEIWTDAARYARWLEVEMREENAVLRCDGQAEDGRRRHQPEEHQRIVVAVLPLEMLEQAGRPRPLAAHPESRLLVR